MTDSARPMLSKMPLRFLDIETLGLEDHHPIIEIAVLDKEGNAMIHTKVRPIGDPASYVVDADPVALGWGAYVDDDGSVSDTYLQSPTMVDIAPRLFDALDGCQVWGHTISFDVRRLKKRLSACGINYPRRFARPCFGVEVLAAEHLPFLKSMSLISIAESLGISTENAHTALVDANLARRIYLALHRASSLDRWIIKKNHLEQQERPL